VPELHPIQWNWLTSKRKNEMGVDPAWQIVHDPELVSNPQRWLLELCKAMSKRCSTDFPSGSLPLLRWWGKFAPPTWWLRDQMDVFN
jgi:hypothetical protein